MAESTTQSKKFEWKWVGITFVMYVVLYLLPILLAFGFLGVRFGGHAMDIFLSIWSFAGIIIISALCGYLSKGVTIWEPAMASLTLATIVLTYLAFKILSASIGGRISAFHVIVPALVMLVTVLFLSLLGAWLGELAQSLWRKESPQ